MREVGHHEKYLGLPTVIGRSKKVVFGCLKDRVWKKLQGWKEKLLSRPEKEILLKVVSQAIPTYMMSIFSILDGLLDEIASLMAKNWWGSKEKERGIHWKSWECLGLPKNLGGLGFRDLKVFNQALLAKQGWKLLLKTSTLVARVLKARHFPNSRFISSFRGSNPSFSWRSIWGAKSLLREGLIYRVGKGLVSMFGTINGFRVVMFPLYLHPRKRSV